MFSRDEKSRGDERQSWLARASNARLNDINSDHHFIHRAEFVVDTRDRAAQNARKSGFGRGDGVRRDVEQGGAKNHLPEFRRQYAPADDVL